MSIIRPPGCTCIFEGGMLVKRCEQCEAELRELSALVRKGKKA